MTRHPWTASAAATAVFLNVLPALANKVGLTTFEGTRAQVRAACTGKDRMLVEGGDTTTCMDNARGTGVTCDDSETCWGTTPGRARRGPGSDALDRRTAVRARPGPGPPR